jgi:hypothetical protein
VIRDAKIPPPTQVPCRGVQLSAASACGQFCVTGSLSDHPTRIVPALRRRQTGGSPSRWTELVELELPGLPWLVAAVVGGLGLGLGLAGAGWAGGSPHFRKQRRNASLGSLRCCMLSSKPGSLLHARRGRVRHPAPVVDAPDAFSQRGVWAAQTRRNTLRSTVRGSNWKCPCTFVEDAESRVPFIYDEAALYRT